MHVNVFILSQKPIHTQLLFVQRAKNKKLLYIDYPVFFFYKLYIVYIPFQYLISMHLIEGFIIFTIQSYHLFQGCAQCVVQVGQFCFTSEKQNYIHMCLLIFFFLHVFFSFGVWFFVCFLFKFTIPRNLSVRCTIGYVLILLILMLVIRSDGDHMTLLLQW